MRKRLTKQIDDAKVFGIQSFCKDLLAVADVLNKASADVTEEIVAKENSSYLKDVVEGVRLTEAQLQQGRNLQKNSFGQNPREPSLKIQR